GKFGGFPKVANTLGYPSKPRSDGRIWRTIEDLRPHLDPLVFEIGRMPSVDELNSRGLYRLTGPIHKFGGLHKVAQQLGYPYDFRRIQSRRGSSKWKSVEDLRPLLEPLAQRLGRMPSSREIMQDLNMDLTDPIKKFGGVHHV